jgi:hypothetical protein
MLPSYYPEVVPVTPHVNRVRSATPADRHSSGGNMIRKLRTQRDNQQWLHDVLVGKGLSKRHRRIRLHQGNGRRPLGRLRVDADRQAGAGVLLRTAMRAGTCVALQVTFSICSDQGCRNQI